MATTGRVARSQDVPHGVNGWVGARMMPFFHGPMYPKAAAALDLQADDDLLEVACGAGVLLQDHAAHVRYVAGLDASDIQVGLARRRLGDRIAAGTAEVVLGDAVALPWVGGRFTAVACMGSIELMPEPQKTLTEIRRVLSPDGRAVLSMGSRFIDQKAKEKWAGQGFWTWAEQDVRAMVHDAGFVDCEISYFKWGGSSMLGGLFNWLIRASAGSDEVRLVRVRAT